MHKARRLNQANVSITATRWCNRRCTHCYIDPAELANRAYMSTETFQAIFPRMRELLAIDHGLEEIEWELIGGEITSMPVEYWQENLPYALDQCRDFNSVLKTPGSINVLSNLIFSDERKRRDYLDLFAKYGQRPEMCLYTSWEPDTNRFGKGMALFDRWKATVAEAQVDKKILDVILTRATVEKGPEYLLETFLPLGIKDFSIKLISPYGSGRTFWQPNMIEFEQMSQYLCRLLELIPEGITFTPADEMSSAVFRGTSYQCIGNFRYDLAIEPDGLTTFNANQTTDEASVGDARIFISDPDWKWKVLADNTSELDNKLSRYHDYCFQCEYHSYCAGGWYHYRIAAPDDVRAWDQGDCPGFKKLWSKISERYGQFDRGTSVHRETLQRIKEGRANSGIEERVVCEVDGQASTFAEWVKQGAGCVVEMAGVPQAGKPIMERLWAYQAVGARCRISCDVFAGLGRFEQRMLVEHLVFDDFFHVDLEQAVVWAWADNAVDDPLARLLLNAETFIGSADGDGALITSDHNSELLRWVLQNGRAQVDGDHPDPAVQRTQLRLRSEARMARPRAAGVLTTPS